MIEQVPVNVVNTAINDEENVIKDIQVMQPKKYRLDRY